MSEKVEVLDRRGATRLVRVAGSGYVVLRLERFDEADLDWVLVRYIGISGETLTLIRGPWCQFTRADSAVWREKLRSAKSIGDFNRLFIEALFTAAARQA